MARKEIYVTIQEGRDQGKVFKVTEAPAMQTDKWIMRVTLALNKNGAVIPDEIMNLGLVGLIVGGIHKLSGVDWQDLEPLLDEMMSCVTLVPTPSQPAIVRKVMVDDIEEVQTFSLLRKEVFQLHVGFLSPADRSTSPPSAGAKDAQD